MGLTVAQKIWDRHVVSRRGDQDLLYMDLHLVHELSPQAFAGLELRDLPVRRPDLTLATMDHSVPTVNRSTSIADPRAAKQLGALRSNCDKHGITLHELGGMNQGIVHIIGPELGLTQPGMTIACGDSHTTTHGALGALAFGIGTSQVEHVLAAQCLFMPRLKQMAVEIDGELPTGVTAKDVALVVVATLGFGGAAGYVVEYCGSTVRNLSIESRLTLCNMAAEAGARAGLIAPDQKTEEYLRGRRHAAKGDDWETATEFWRNLQTDADASFDRTIHIDATMIEPRVTWGTTPAMSVPVTGRVPVAENSSNPTQVERALSYMGLKGGEQITDIPIDVVFIGSCTNSRIEDLRAAAKMVSGKQVSPHVRAMVVPGSMPVKAQAESEGLDQIFTNAGFEWREPGCSMCLAMNADILEPGQRCASTSNRNFEGRQGAGGRTHLLSPAMAAAAAIAGHFVDVRKFGLE